jgi:hypothetical protein
MHQGTSVMVSCVPVRAAGKRRKLRFATLYKEGAFCAQPRNASNLVARGFLLLHAKKIIWRNIRVSAIRALRRRARENAS